MISNLGHELLITEYGRRGFGEGLEGGRAPHRLLQHSVHQALQAPHTAQPGQPCLLPPVYTGTSLVFRIHRIHRIHMFLGLPDPNQDLLVRGPLLIPYSPSIWSKQTNTQLPGTYPTLYLLSLKIAQAHCTAKNNGTSDICDKIFNGSVN